MTDKVTPPFTLAYAASSIVFGISRILAGVSDIRYISVVVCLVSFLLGDVYCFFGWQMMKKKQGE